MLPLGERLLQRRRDGTLDVKAGGEHAAKRGEDRYTDRDKEMMHKPAARRGERWRSCCRSWQRRSSGSRSWTQWEALEQNAAGLLDVRMQVGETSTQSLSAAVCVCAFYLLNQCVIMWCLLHSLFFMDELASRNG